MCYATHGEQNALLQCRDTELIHTAYCTASPCITCVKLLMNTGCQRIVYQEEYPHPESKNLWIMAGRDWIQMPANNLIELFRVASERSESAQTKSQGG